MNIRAKLSNFFSQKPVKSFVFPAILIVTILFFMLFNNYLQINQSVGGGDISAFHRATREFAKTSIVEYGEFPHWNPYYYGGTPHWANPLGVVFAFPVLFVLISPTVQLGMNFTILFNLLFAGIFMYLAALQLRLRSHYADC